MFEGTGLGNPTVFWVTRFLLLAILIWCGWGISYGKKEHFNRYALISCIFYSLIEGLRWMRGADYCHYYNDIVSLFGVYNGVYGEGVTTPDPELLYEAWINVMYYCGVPFWVVFILYSALLITGVLLILKVYPKIALWALPMFFLVTIRSSENLIRQYFAICFVILAYYYYLRDKRILMYIMLLIAPFIHYSTVAVDALFLFFVYTSRFEKIWNNKIILIILLCVFVYSYWFFELSSLQIVSDFINQHNDMMDEDNKASIYVMNADRWATEEGSMSMVLNGSQATALSLIANTSRFLSYLIIIVLGFFTMKDDKRLILPYYFSYGAILLSSMGSDIEMFARFYNLTVVFLPVIFGMLLTKIKMNDLVKTIIVSIFAIHYLWYNFMSSMLGTSLFGYAFIWDANVPLM